MAASGGARVTLTALSAGAAGAILAGNSDIVAHLLNEVGKAVAAIALRMSQSESNKGGSNSNSDVSELALQVKEMSSLLNKVVLQQRYTGENGRIVTSPSWMPMLFCASGMLYLTGYKIFSLDSFFVTPSSFRKGIRSVETKVECLAEKMKQLKNHLVQKFVDLEEKQEEKLSDLSVKIDLIHSKQEFSNRGIFLLCKVVMKHLNAGRSATELEKYLKDDYQSSTKSLAGLRELLEENPKKPKTADGYLF